MPACLPKRFAAWLGQAPSPVRWLIVDAEAITNVDYTAARMVRQLHKELVDRGVVLVFARAPLSLKADLDRHLLTRGHRPGAVFRPPSRCGGCIRETQRSISKDVLMIAG